MTGESARAAPHYRWTGSVLHRPDFEQNQPLGFRRTRGSTTESNEQLDENRASVAAEDRLNIVAIRIEHEGGVIARRVALGGIAKSRWAIISPACLHGGLVEGVDFGAVPGRERRMLLHAVWVKAVNPENREIDTIADAIDPVVFGKLHDPMEA